MHAEGILKGRSKLESLINQNITVGEHSKDLSFISNARLVKASSQYFLGSSLVDGKMGMNYWTSRPRHTPPSVPLSKLKKRRLNSLLLRALDFKCRFAFPEPR
ncbi:hypothetical protein ACET3Z_002370 [Daucus carota]